MADVLKVEIREGLGSRASQKLRDGGKTPAVLYGHGEATVHLSAPSDSVAGLIRHGGKLVELDGALKEKAFVKQVQWDPMGLAVLHLDLTRVSAHEKVLVTVPVELRGEAAGSKEGGIIEHVLHDVQIVCPAESLPDRLSLRIADLHLGQALYARDLTLPPGATLETAGDAMIVHCVAPTGTDEEEAAATESAEPELIGRRPEGEDSEEE